MAEFISAFISAPSLPWGRVVLRDAVFKQERKGGDFFLEHEVMAWFVQLCLAMEHVHGHKILHRDLKTGNVFLSRRGVVKLGDFGLSTVLANTLAVANTVCGTPYCFSPELCSNKDYDTKSDVWAMGCILYELCALQYPFEAPNMKKLVDVILKGEYARIPHGYAAPAVPNAPPPPKAKGANAG